MRKLLMNCDQVFDVLTRGPFPTGAASDEDVERHLRACHECRHLAEALQPAVELLHESLAPDQAAELPEYQGVLATIEHSVATAARPRPLSVRQLARLRATQRRQVWASYFAQLAIVVALLMAIGTLGWNLITTAPHHGQRHLLGRMLPPSEAKPVARLDDRGLVTLTSLDLPAGCFPAGALIDTTPGGGQSAVPAAISQDALRCCTECHRAGHASRGTPRTVAAMSRSCVACHAL